MDRFLLDPADMKLKGLNVGGRPDAAHGSRRTGSLSAVSTWGVHVEQETTVDRVCVREGAPVTDDRRISAGEGEGNVVQHGSGVGCL